MMDAALRHRGPIAGVAASGSHVATAGYDNQVILWDSATRQPLARGMHDHLVNQCAFSADGRWLVSASSDCSARVWAVPEMRLHAVLTGHRDDVDMAAFSPDDQFIATCALDRSVRIFDRAGRCLHEMHGHTGNVLSLAWTADGRQVVSTSVDGSLRTWCALTGTALAVTDLQVRSDSVEISPEGTVYAADDLGRVALIQDGATRFVRAHRAGVKKIALNAEKGLLVSLSYDRSLAVWRVQPDASLMLMARSELPETIWARAACVLPDGRIAVGTFGNTYAVFDPNSLLWDLHGVAAGRAINAVLSVGRKVYSVGDAGQVRVNDATLAEMGSLCNFLVAAGERVFTGGQLGQVYNAATGVVLYQHHSPLNCATAFERDNRPHLAVGSYTGEILLFALDQEGCLTLVQTLAMYENAVKGLKACDGVLFSVCANTDVAWHDVADGKLLHHIRHGHERIANACCAIGGGRFASVSRDRSLRLWALNELGVTEIFASPHPNSVKCVAVNDDQTLLLTGSYGGTLALFDLQLRRWAALQRPTVAGISSITWDSAGGQFLAASYDGQLYPVMP